MKIPMSEQSRKLVRLYLLYTGPFLFFLVSMFIYKGIIILLALTVIVIFISTKPSKWTELFSLNIAWYTIGLFIVFSATSALWSLTPVNTLYKVLPLIAMAFLALIAVNFAMSLADNEIKALNTGIIYGGFLGFSILAIELIGQAHITQILRASVGKFSGTPEEIYHKLKSYLHHIEFELEPLTIKQITEIMNEKRAIYNLNVDQRTKKFGKGEKLLKYDFQKLPDYIKNNKSKYERWLD